MILEFGIYMFWVYFATQHLSNRKGVLFLQKNKKLSFHGCQNRVLVRKYMRGRKLFTCPAAVDKLFDNWIHLHRIHSCFCRVTYKPLQNRAMMFLTERETDSVNAGRHPARRWQKAGTMILPHSHSPGEQRIFGVSRRRHWVRSRENHVGVRFPWSRELKAVRWRFCERERRIRYHRMNLMQLKKQGSTCMYCHNLFGCWN